MVKSVLDIDTPRAFLPLVHHQGRFRGAKGGRGSGKSHFFAEDIVLDMLVKHTRVVCGREIQNSIQDSVKQLLEDKITRFGLRNRFRITDREISYAPTDSLCIFRGLQNHTVASIKSLEGFNRFFGEEAQTFSQRSLDLLIPTFRAGSKLDFAWNPESKKDPIERFFNENLEDPDFCLVHVNYDANPWFPDELRRDMLRDRRRDIDKYSHVWLGKYKTRSEARVFRNWRIEDFETPANVRFYFGADWGFSVDPTVLIRAFMIGETLYVDHEAHAVGCEIDNTPALFAGDDIQTPPRWSNPNRYPGIPGSLKWPLVADSARPETISYMRKRGFTRMTPSVKGKGSVEDGIEFLKNYDIVVHPRCVHTIDELASYSYKVDEKTQEILPVLADKKNHLIDALRYALEGTRRSSYTLANVG